MSGSVLSGSINNLPVATTPQKMHHCDRRFGLLYGIWPSEGCQIAKIGESLVVLPPDLALSGLMGHRVGLVRIDDQYLIRRLA